MSAMNLQNQVDNMLMRRAQYQVGGMYAGLHAGVSGCDRRFKPQSYKLSTGKRVCYSKKKVAKPKKVKEVKPKKNQKRYCVAKKRGPSGKQRCSEYADEEYLSGDGVLEDDLYGNGMYAMGRYDGGRCDARYKPKTMMKNGKRVCRKNIERATKGSSPAKKAAKRNPWLMHLAAVRRKHKGLSQPEIAQIASKSYRRK